MDEQRPAVFDRRGYKITSKAGKAEILIYEEIGSGWLGGISAKQFAEDIGKMPKAAELTVRINSEGGSVFDGQAIYNTLRNYDAPVHVVIDGLAASIASIIAMAGDTRVIAENGFFMIHDPWMVAAGTAQELRDSADMMDKVRERLVNTYQKRTGQAAEDIAAWMAAETWMDAEEAFERGFVTGIDAEQRMAACVRHPDRYAHVPQALVEPQHPRRERVALNINTYLRESVKQYV